MKLRTVLAHLQECVNGFSETYPPYQPPTALFHLPIPRNAKSYEKC